MYFIVVRETDDAPAEAGILVESIRREYLAVVETPVVEELDPIRALVGAIENSIDFDDSWERTVWSFKAWFAGSEAARDFCGRVPVEDLTVPDWGILTGMHPAPCHHESFYHSLIFHATIANSSQDDYDVWAWCRARGEDGLIESETALSLEIPATVRGWTKILTSRSSLVDGEPFRYEALQIQAQHRVEVHVSVGRDPCDENAAIEFEFQVRR